MDTRGRRRAAANQPNLFEPRPDRPRWQALPTEMRTAVTKLFARMLTEQRRRHAAPTASGVEHE